MPGLSLHRALRGASSLEGKASLLGDKHKLKGHLFKGRKELWKGVTPLDCYEVLKGRSTDEHRLGRGTTLKGIDGKTYSE